MRHGFRLLREQRISSVGSDCHFFRHEKSGADLLFLDNPDDNRVFSIAFRTPPPDNSGLPHVIEHCVLCGSRKYPLKDPFIELDKGSLCTFLNAMTMPDSTVFPVASRNRADIFNLMDVYLDAVFYPKLLQDPRILKQEGIRLQPGKQRRFIPNGVVYNEMRGFFAAPEALLLSRAQRSLFPDNEYGCESGGDPDLMLDLTHEKVVSFHRRYYHPSNCLIFLYGRWDLDEVTAYLDREYLSGFELSLPASRIGLQPGLSKPLDLELSYPVSGRVAGKTCYSLNFATGLSTDLEFQYLLEILKYALFDKPGAVLREKLAGMGKDSFTVLSRLNLQPVFSIVVRDAPAGKKTEFRDLIFNTLADVQRDGIDPQILKAGLNRLEFAVREGEGGDVQRGINCNFFALGNWIHGCDPFLSLDFEAILRRISMDTATISTMIRNCFLENQHQSLFTLIPESGLLRKREQELRMRLRAMGKAATTQEWKKQLEADLDFREWQAIPENADKACLPLLELSEIDRNQERILQNLSRHDEVIVLQLPQQTSGICYLDLYFDVSGLNCDEIPYLGLLATLLGRLSTRKRSFSELSTLTDLYTGGIEFDVQTFSESDSVFHPRLCVRAKALARELPRLFELLTELITEQVFFEAGRLLELYYELKCGIEEDIVSQGEDFARRRLLSYFSGVERYEELLSGLSFYSFLRKIEGKMKSSGKKVAIELERVYRLVFNRLHLACFTASAEESGNFELHFERFRKSIPQIKSQRASFDSSDDLKNEGLAVEREVQSIAQGYNFNRLGCSYSGKMAVLESIVTLDYLWEKARGSGAYGVYLSLERNGNACFVSHSDPNLAETLQMFRETGKYLDNFRPSEREMRKYIIGTIGKFDEYLTPAQKGERAACDFLSGRSHEDLQRERDEILSTTPSDIRSFAGMIDELTKKNCLCVLGSAPKIRKSRSLFSSVSRLI
ncbi:MAG: insulinase family protein [Candidatus Wallbacteria bacterium]|nr:insulinase family protein [Candidatus Wallbacteria bacterium]